MANHLIMAIDQGGTKTDIIIAENNGRIVGAGNDRDWVAVSGERRAVRMLRIRHAAEKATADAGIKLSDINSVSATCIGADWGFEYETGRNNLRNTLGIEQVFLYNDCIGALRGGTEIKGKDCAVLCLGTGANCAVINREGREYIYAYYLKNTHHGAEAIGKFIFQAVFDAECGLGPESSLTKLLLEKTGCKSVDELLMSVTTGRTETETPWKPVYQEYCPLLFEAIRAGDRTASEYIQWLCDELARYVIVAAGKLNMLGREITVVLSGGVPKSGAIMGDLLQKRFEADLPAFKCLNARFEPVVGALLLEYDRIYPGGIPMEVTRNIEQSCVDRKLFRIFRTGEA